MRRLCGFGLVALVFLHQDVWFWSVDTRVLGLPVGLSYHVALCIAVSAMLYGLGKSLVDRNEEA